LSVVRAKITSPEVLTPERKEQDPPFSGEKTPGEILGALGVMLARQKCWWPEVLPVVWVSRQRGGRSTKLSAGPWRNREK
jgi:hypothetical protein